MAICRNCKTNFSKDWGVVLEGGSLLTQQLPLCDSCRATRAPKILEVFTSPASAIQFIRTASLHMCANRAEKPGTS